TTQASTSVIYKGSVKQAIIGVQIVMSTGTASILNMLDFTTNGTTNSATDITNAKVYYTGNSSTFATSTQFGSAYTAPSYGFQINGTQSLLSGTNYFWLTYDVPSGATSGNYLDATLESFDLDSQSVVTNYIPTVTNPTGDRKIIPAYCSPTWVSNLGAELGIKQVSIGTINNITTAPNGAGNTVDYTSQSATLQKGASVSMTIKTGTYTYYNNASVHIDWNADGVFQTSERVYDYYVGASGGSQYTLTFNVAVPCGASLGTTRMRVINEYYCCTAPTTGGLACGVQTNYGEAEDYTVLVTDSALSYVASNSTQPITSDVFANSSNKEIARVMVVLKGCSGTQTLTDLNLNTNGSTNASNDITSAKVYFTGSSSTFATTTLFGTTASPNGAFTVSGSQSLSTDTNYLWIAYDIASGATTNNVVDVEVSSMTINATSQTPSITAPSGNRKVNVPMTYSSSQASFITTGNINKSNRFGEMVKLKVTMNSGASVALTNLAMNTTGSNNIGSNVDTVRVFYTGTSNSFATSTLVGYYVGSLTSTFNITGSQSLFAGDNYFWATYSVKSTATTGDSLTGHITQITVDGSNQTPTDNVVGKRRIIPPYCIGSYSNDYTTTMFMSRVKIGAIDNSTSYAGYPAGYNYYNTQTCSLAVGQTDTLKVQGGNTYNITVGVFADLNQDGDFNDAGEKLGENQNVSFTALNNIIVTIPNGATPGLTRLRVRNNYQANTVTPCTTLTYGGETEDYNIYIIPPAAPSPSITPSSSVTFCQSIGQVFSTPLNSSYNYAWKVNGTNVYTGTGSPYNQYNFNPGSAGNYTLQVVATDAYAQSGSSSTINVTVNANPVGGTASVTSTSICAGDNDTLKVTGNTGSIQWQQKVGAGSWTNISGATTSTYVITPSVTASYRCASTLGSCGTAYSSAVTVSLGTSFVWAGGVSTDWRNAANWCNGTVPTASSVVVIPVRANMPVLAGNGVCSTLTINSGASLTL
ncbi:MAG: hypothetical protein HYZ42_05280, partial [Bacteroidetes bacterium]|nr:hypothetical protein [Bacteroidota bacterium]